MLLKVERGAGVESGRADELGREVVYSLKRKLLVTPEVEVVNYGRCRAPNARASGSLTTALRIR